MKSDGKCPNMANCCVKLVKTKEPLIGIPKIITILFNESITTFIRHFIVEILTAGKSIIENYLLLETFFSKKNEFLVFDGLLMTSKTFFLKGFLSLSKDNLVNFITILNSLKTFKMLYSSGRLEISLAIM